MQLERTRKSHQLKLSQSYVGFPINLPPTDLHTQFNHPSVCQMEGMNTQKEPMFPLLGEKNPHKN